MGRRLLLWLDPFPTPGNEAHRTEPVRSVELLAALRRWAVTAMVLFLCTETIDSSLVAVQAVFAFGCCIAVAVIMVIGAVYITLRAS